MQNRIICFFLNVNHYKWVIVFFFCFAVPLFSYSCDWNQARQWWPDIDLAHNQLAAVKKGLCS